MKKFTILLTALSLLAACKTSQKTAKGTPDNPIYLDPMELVITPPPAYQATAQKDMDILHTKLAVAFDWEKQRLNGTATLTVKPYFYPQNTLILDAKSFDIHQIALLKNNAIAQDLSYTYDSLKIKIQLDKTYSRNDTFMVLINYTAKPNERKTGGSNAISEDKGLYFINADGKDTSKPTQVWTQGETEANSCWFPTIDKPNEKSTEEIYITVDNKYTTLSNGLLISSTDNKNGTRTDYWKMDLPHSVYLFMLAAGEFEIIKDKWRNIAVDYYVEPFNAKNAKRIFGETPQMLEFFSTRLGVDYPWQKYAQIIVRDYVSGAMENTTATLHGEFINRTEKELVDEDYHDIVAHELFHHWFGDLVTAESWSNLPLNESFADYSEYLWNEHRYGKEYADFKKMSALKKYFNESKYEKNVPLIRFHYKDKEDMFDAHSYEKGGAILHMLRHEIGDEAFFASLELYLRGRMFNNAEINDLRMAIEQVTGRDMNYFFNQWFMTEGHPKININYAISNDTLTISLSQKSNVEKPIAYTINTNVDIHYGNVIERKRITFNQKNQDFKFALLQAPTLVDVDPERIILCERTETKSAEDFAALYENGHYFFQRKQAIDSLRKQQRNSLIAQTTMSRALGDKSDFLRSYAVQNLFIPSVADSKWDEILAMAENDKSPLVRAAALEKLADNAELATPALIEKGLQDSSCAVNAQAMLLLFDVDSAKGVATAKAHETDRSNDIKKAVNDIYAMMYNDPTRLDYFKNKILTSKSYNKYYMYYLLAAYLTKQDPATAKEGINFITTQALQESNSDGCLWAAGSLDRFKNLRETLSTEKDLLQLVTTSIVELQKASSK